MGLKWFRARLSIKKEKAKIPAMMGLYRRVSHSELNVAAMSKNEDISNPPPTISSDSTAIANNGAQYDRTADFIIDEDENYHRRQLLIPKKHGNQAIVNAEPSTSIKDLNLKEQSLSQDEESNNMNTEQNDNSDKSRLDNELVI